MIQIKTPDEIALMRAAGLVVGRARWQRAAGRGRARASPPASWTRSPRTRSAAEGAVPSFKGYHRGFPATICASVNDEIVHGIPGPRGAARGRHHLASTAARSSTAGTATRRSRSRSARCARSCRELIRVTEESLWRGLAAALAGGRLTDIGAAVESSIRVRSGAGTASSRSTAATASAPRCTRTRTCSTTAGPAAGRGWCRAWRWRSSRWSPWATRHPGAGRRLDGRHRRRVVRGALGAHGRVTEDGPWVLTAWTAARPAGELGVRWRSGHEHGPVGRTAAGRDADRTRWRSSRGLARAADGRARRAAGAAYAARPGRLRRSPRPAAERAAPAARPAGRRPATARSRWRLTGVSWSTC